MLRRAIAVVVLVAGACRGASSRAGAYERVEGPNDRPIPRTLQRLELAAENAFTARFQSFTVTGRYTMRGDSVFLVPAPGAMMAGNLDGVFRGEELHVARTGATEFADNWVLRKAR